MLSAFRAAVDKYGLPQKVRSDLSGENINVWCFMIAQFEDERVVITVRSTHNERLEHLWRDMFRCVGKLFYDAF